LKSCGDPALQEFSSHRGVFLSGVAIAATAFANILKDPPRRPVESHLFIACSFSFEVSWQLRCVGIEEEIGRAANIIHNSS
jgi:hypothetical protein